jgi:sugar phosphate isomerase/epimerase
MAMDRRRFVSTLGATLATPSLLRAQQRRIERIGIQLYTLRKEMENDFEGTLARVRRIGYREVEFAGYFGHPPSVVRTMLARNDISSPSAHVEAKMVEADWHRTLAEAAAVGHDFITAAWIDEGARRTLDDWRRWAEKFNRAAEEAKAVGLRFAYHNHNYEFAPVGGRIPYDVLVEGTDPDLVAFEMDLFWIISAGGDPVSYFEKHPHRFPMLHIKDMTAAPAKKMVDAGSGVIDFRRIFAHAGTAGVRHWFVEHDEPADAFASARASFAYLDALRY